PPTPPTRTGIVLLTDSRLPADSERPYVEALAASGAAPDAVDVANADSIALDTIAALVVPFSVAASLPTKQVTAIEQATRARLVVYTEGDSALARALGVPLRDSMITLGGLRNRAHPDVGIEWAAPQMMTAIDANGLDVFDESPDSGDAVVVGGAL